MSLLQVIQAFTDLTQRVRRHSELRALIVDATRELGFDYFALLHHVDLKLAAPHVVRLSNYPEGFVAVQSANRYFADDPVFRAAQRSVRGFAWTELARLTDLSARQRDVLARAARAGLGEGYTAPLHVPGEFAASGSFVTRAGKTLKSATVPYLHHFSSFAFEAGRRIAMHKSVRTHRPYRLSTRQLDCLVLIARGNTARQAADRLGLKQDTVEKHLSAVKARVGVRATPRLIARCLFDGKITFQDILSEKIP